MLINHYILKNRSQYSYDCCSPLLVASSIEHMQLSNSSMLGKRTRMACFQSHCQSQRDYCERIITYIPSEWNIQRNEGFEATFLLECAGWSKLEEFWTDWLISKLSPRNYQMHTCSANTNTVHTSKIKPLRFNHFLCTHKVTASQNRSIYPAVYIISADVIIFEVLRLPTQQSYPIIWFKFNLQRKNLWACWFSTHKIRFSIAFYASSNT